MMTGDLRGSSDDLEEDGGTDPMRNEGMRALDAATRRNTGSSTSSDGVTRTKIWQEEIHEK